MNNPKIEKKGGNQYLVTINDESQLIDLDGLDVVSDDDYETIVQAGADTEWLISPKDGYDDFHTAALEYAANYTGIIVEDYIEAHAS